jgi:hypothetical protein
MIIPSRMYDLRKNSKHAKSSSESNAIVAASAIPNI